MHCTLYSTLLHYPKSTHTGQINILFLKTDNSPICAAEQPVCSTDDFINSMKIRFENWVSYLRQEAYLHAEHCFLSA